jgi:hypothetical protein
VETHHSRDALDLHMFTHPFNILRSSKCDVDQKLLLLDAAIARELQILCNVQHDWTIIKKKQLVVYLCDFPEIAAAYSRTVAIIKDSTQPKHILRSHLQSLICSFMSTQMQCTCCNYITTYIVEFATDSDYKERAQTCKDIFISDPSNIRALYLYYFFSQVGKGYDYALENRYRLYSAILNLCQKYTTPLCLSPLLGVSIGHYYLLAQAICSGFYADRLKLFISSGQIGSELIEFFEEITRCRIDKYDFNETLNIEILLEAFNADVIAYSCCVRGNHNAIQQKHTNSENVCLHLRTEGYKSQGGSWNLLRNSSPSNFESLGQYILDNSTSAKLIRIHCPGDLAYRNSCWTSHIVDDFAGARKQWEIMQDTSLFIGCNSGISALAPFLSQSALIVNATSLWSVVALHSQVVFALKRVVGLKANSNKPCREDFIRLLYLDWVGSAGLCNFFEIEELSPTQLVTAYTQATSNLIVTFSAVCAELRVHVTKDLPERYLTLECASNICSVALGLELESALTPAKTLSRVMWQ